MGNRVLTQYLLNDLPRRLGLSDWITGQLDRAPDRQERSGETGIEMKSISILTPCYNEEANVEEVYRRVRDVMAGLGRYRYEHLFIDNCSTDRTVEILKRIAAADRNVKIIVNARNFGHIRSPMHAVYKSAAMPRSVS